MGVQEVGFRCCLGFGFQDLGSIGFVSRILGLALRAELRGFKNLKFGGLMISFANAFGRVSWQVMQTQLGPLLGVVLDWYSHEVSTDSHSVRHNKHPRGPVTCGLCVTLQARRS